MDLDGVICKEPSWIGHGYRWAPHLTAWFRDKFIDVYARPRQPIVIITGRPRCDITSTLEWLDRHMIACSDILFQPSNDDIPNTQQILLHKIRSINMLNLQYYIESSAYLAHNLKLHCPLTTIYHYESMTYEERLEYFY